MRPSRPEDVVQQRVTEALSDIVGHRAVIEQAKGMLMATYGIDADKAFELLRWQSQEHNVKLRLIAEQVVRDFVELAKSRSGAERVAADSLLLSAYERITEIDARQSDGSIEDR